jgi:hypothetical protein
MTPAEAKALFPPFLEFAKTLEGDEKSEAQIFLDHLFRALGHDGAKEAGATFEYRVAKKPGTSQLSLFKDDELKGLPKQKAGVKFADLLWPGRVLRRDGIRKAPQPRYTHDRAVVISGPGTPRPVPHYGDEIDLTFEDEASLDRACDSTRLHRSRKGL